MINRSPPIAGRRALLKGALANGTLFASGLPIKARAASVFSLQEFGLKRATDDPAAAFRAALKAAANFPEAILEIPSGTWTFSQTDGVCIAMNQTRSLTIRGKDNCNLVFRDQARPFDIRSAQSVTLSNFSIDWERPPFSQGVITATNSSKGYFDVAVDGAFPVTGKETIVAFTIMDENGVAPKLAGVDSPETVAHIALIAPQRLRLFSHHAAELTTGSAVILRHSVGPAAIYFHHTCDIKLDALRIYACPGMAIVAENCRGIIADSVRIEPKPGSLRWLSSNADGFHLASCGGDIAIRNTTITATGDDAINIHSMIFEVTSDNDFSELTFPVRSIDHISEGEEVQVLKSATLAPVSDFRVLTTAVSDGSETITGHDVHGVQPGDVLISMSIVPSIVIENCTFARGRARGVLVHQNARITGCSFLQYGREAILLTLLFPSEPIDRRIQWEGPAINDIKIDHCSLTDCCRQMDDSAFVSVYGIRIDARGKRTPATSQIFSDILVSDCIFRLNSKIGISVSNVTGLTLAQNVFSSAGRDYVLKGDTKVKVVP